MDGRNRICIMGIDLPGTDGNHHGFDGGADRSVSARDRREVRLFRKPKKISAVVERPSRMS